MRALKTILFLFLFLGIKSQAQTFLEAPISLSLSNQSLKQFIQQVEKSTELTFSYSDNILDKEILITRKFEEVPLFNVLDEILIPHHISYQLVGTSIVLYRTVPEKSWFFLSGFIRDSSTSEDLIGAAVYVEDLGIGTVTNGYGFYSLKIPAGEHKLKVYNLGYAVKAIDFNLMFHNRLNVNLQSQNYDLDEVVISTESEKLFMESRLINLQKIDIEKFRELPGFFGENDALRNLSVLPGIQTNEVSTSSINVRGGGTDQTVFLMDEATLFDASHFGGFFSVFNPDVVNNINVFKSDIPVSEGGALSSLIDVRLREGNKQKWEVSGGVGLISARGSVEGPLKKDESSMLLAFRRTYVDGVAQVFATDPEIQKIRFYFYDANLKMNFKLGKNDRLFLSGYSGSDSFTQNKLTERANYLGALRWNHLFGSKLFSNVSFIVSKNVMKQGTQEQKELLYWQSSVNNVKGKADISYYVSKSLKGTFGLNSSLYNIFPFSLLTETEDAQYTRYESSLEQMLLNSIYFTQNILLKKKLGIDIGLRATHMYTDPFTDSLIGTREWFFEPQLKLGYIYNTNNTVKASFSRQIQPLHQLPISMIGIAVNRWMIASKDFRPQLSNNFTLGVYHNIQDRWSLSVEGYYRRMYNLIETMQDQHILYTDDPVKYLYKSEAEAYGTELLFSYNWKKIKGMLSYDYCKALWKTNEISDQAYVAPHTREHTLNISNVYKLNKRIAIAATWVVASGIPYTPANGKYQIDGRTYLQSDENHINTKRTPPYHRLDLSVDLESKKNNIRKWKGYWNFSIYNVYFRKNPLGVAYFIPEQQENVTVQILNPGFYYLYRFVPSVSYRFKF